MKSAVLEPGFGARLTKACDQSPHCPPLSKGRYFWLTKQLEAGFDVKVSIETIRRWLAGEVKPRYNRHIYLASILGVDSNWLLNGTEPDLTPQQKVVRNAEAAGIVNVVAGFISMDGGSPSFPNEGEAKATKDHVDLRAIIKGAHYNFQIVLASRRNGTWQFNVATPSDDVVVLGVIRDAFAVRIIELTPDLIGENGKFPNPEAVVVTLSDEQIDAGALKSFSKRL